ncbi:hypothetical protein HPB51_022207 [Rhipicephalus microplus]|uniref:Uncharacterized protein n=1 Tax=Rhipicephalus microplus TaxID=6941 RepID=A0A9J6DCI9_RHIMP|nr:hypothetical protein HPB51_022207 [Rhipicephalus microplus]
MNVGAFTLQLIVCTFLSSTSRGEDDSAAWTSETQERRPKTLRSTESYTLQPSDSSCLLLPWSAIFTVLFRQLTEPPKDNSFLKDVSVAPEDMPGYLSEHQPHVKFILLFTNFAWILVALVGMAVIGARFANQCGGNRQQEVGPKYMYYYTKILTIVEGVIILALCAFVVLFAANDGLGASIRNAPGYFEKAIHDLRVYTNLTSSEMKVPIKRQVLATRQRLSYRGFVEFVGHSKMPIAKNWTDKELRRAWDATEIERRHTEELLADIPMTSRAEGKAPQAKAPPPAKGTPTEQGIAKMAKRFAWFDEMTGVWGYYAHPILRPIAVYSIAIAAVVAAVGTAIGHKHHSEKVDPTKRHKVSDIAGHTLLAAAFIMLVFCVAALLVLKRSTPHAIAGQCYICDMYRRKEYQQLDFAQDIAWPAQERADIYANLYVGDVLRYCGGESVPITFFMKKNKGASSKKEKSKEDKKPETEKFALLLPRRARFNCETAASVVEKRGFSLKGGTVRYHRCPFMTSVTRQKSVLGTHGRGTDVEKAACNYYICSVLEHYAQSLYPDFAAGAAAEKAVVISRQQEGPGMCAPVFGIVKSGFSLFCDSFLEYLKSIILTLFLAVLLALVGMPALLMLSKYYLTMIPPPEPVPVPPPSAAVTKKARKKQSKSGGWFGDSGGDNGSDTRNSQLEKQMGFYSHSAKLGKLRANEGVTHSGSSSEFMTAKPKQKAKCSKTKLKAKGAKSNLTAKGAKPELIADTPEKKALNKRSFEGIERQLTGIGGLRLLESPDASDESVTLSSEVGGSATSTDKKLEEPAIRVKNVKTQFKPEWCIVDTSMITIPISQLERARDLLTSSSAGSLSSKKCNIEIVKLPQNSRCLVHGAEPGTVIPTSSAVSQHSAKSSCALTDVRPMQLYCPSSGKSQSVNPTSVKAPANGREMSHLPNK